MTARLRRLALLMVRGIRPCVPKVARVAVLLTLVLAAGAPSLWSSSFGAVEVADAQTGAMTAVYQAGADGEATPTPIPQPPDPNVAPPPPIDTPTPTVTVPPPPPAPSPSPAPASPTPFFGDPCWGDEQITFSPETPRTNNEMVIVVSSSRPHPYGRVAGTEKTTFVRERPGQLGYVWEWSVQLTWPGRHEYVFYVDSTIPCKKTEILVRQQFFTRTPTPTKTPNPNNNNGNNN